MAPASQLVLLEEGWETQESLALEENQINRGSGGQQSQVELQCQKLGLELFNPVLGLELMG